MGRDHTIYALESGYVKYYLDLERHPKRRYIGVAFEREDTLPSPRNAVTKRRLGMVAVPRMEKDSLVEQENSIGAGNGIVKLKLVASKSDNNGRDLLRSGYMYREANWEIGRAAERAGIKVKEWNRQDRWLAWRKKLDKTRRIAQMKDMKSRGKGKAKSQS
jgi:large subunit ribosomal protein L27